MSLYISIIGVVAAILVVSEKLKIKYTDEIYIWNKIKRKKNYENTLKATTTLKRTELMS